MIQQVLDEFQLRYLSYLVDLYLRASQKHILGGREKRRWLQHSHKQALSVVAKICIWPSPGMAEVTMGNQHSPKVALGLRGQRQKLHMASVRWLYLFLFEGRHLIKCSVKKQLHLPCCLLYRLVLESVYSLKSKNRVSHQ